YNPTILRLWGGHVTAVAILDMRVFEYLLGYVLKGLDEVTVVVTQDRGQGQASAEAEEIRTYVANRYMGASEAAMVLFGGRSFPFVSLTPPVMRLRVAVPTAEGFIVLDENSLLGLDDAAAVDDMLSRRVTDVERWLRRPVDAVFDRVGFYWTDAHVEHPGFVTRRLNVGRGRGTIARIVRVPRSSGEPWFLSVVLRRGNPPLGDGAQSRTWEDLRTVHGRQARTYEEVARALGYVQLHEEGRTVMQEMTVFGASPRSFRTTFCMFAVDGNDMSAALDEFGDTMSRDLRGRRDLLLVELRRTLEFMGSSLERCNLPSVGRGPELPSEMNPLVIRVRHELRTRRAERGREFQRLRVMLNEEQGAFVDGVIDDFRNGRVRARYIDALPGRGKTFVVGVLVLGLRSSSLERPLIVVTVASTGVAVSQHAGAFSAPETDGTTAHRRFRISVTPADGEDPPVCQITGGSDAAALLRSCDLVIWDELGNSRRGDVEAVDRGLRELRGSSSVFGGLSFLGVGDFHQIPPVVIGASPEARLEHLVHRSPLWRFFTVTTLRQSVRMGGDAEYSDLVDSLCQGTWPDRSETGLELLPAWMRRVRSTEDALSFAFPNLGDPGAISQGVVMCSTHAAADAYNAEFYRRLPGAEVERHSHDVVDPDHDYISDERLAVHRAYGVPPRVLRIREGAVYGIMRNLSP
ncbi:unnamed protein product, partial [Ectocarpus fasciculatus]